MVTASLEDNLAISVNDVMLTHLESVSHHVQIRPIDTPTSYQSHEEFPAALFTNGQERKAMKCPLIGNGYINEGKSSHRSQRGRHRHGKLPKCSTE